MATVGRWAAYFSTAQQKPEPGPEPDPRLGPAVLCDPVVTTFYPLHILTALLSYWAYKQRGDGLALAGTGTAFGAIQVMSGFHTGYKLDIWVAAWEKAFGLPSTFGTLYDPAVAASAWLRVLAANDLDPDDYPVPAVHPPRDEEGE